MDGEEQNRTHLKKVPAKLDLESDADYALSNSDSPGTTTSSQPLIYHDKLESPPFTPDSPPSGCYRLKRYYARTLAGILVPLAVTCFWLAISSNLLRERDIAAYGSEHEILIYYAWFILAVFGLGLSQYGLAGVEVAMLQHPFWQARNTMVILMHSGYSWAGPAGWLRYISRVITGKHTATHRLWNLLASISLIGSIAIPLSGMSMELAGGYVGTAEHPLVSGRNWENFNSRDTGQTASRGGNAWSTAAPVTVPGIGILYTPPHVNRDDYPQFAQLPNSLPVQEGIPEFFMTAQSATPVNGIAWGLRLKYKCSVVKSASEFKILARKPSLDSVSKELGAVGRSPSFEGNGTIFALSPSPWGRSINIWGYGRIGIDLNGASIYDGSEAPAFDEEDIQYANVLEYAMWQMRFDPAYADLIKHPQFDKLEQTMADMYQPFTLGSNGTMKVQVDRSFFGENEQGTITSIPSKPPISIADPIGVRCSHTSVLGTAKLDARTSTYTDFKQSPSPPFNAAEIESPALRFGHTAAQILAGEYFQIFNALMSAPPEVVSNSVYYRRWVQPTALVEAIMRAYAMDALQLMYDGIYSTEPGASFIAKNLTSSRPGKVLERGRFNPSIPGTLFVIWSMSSAIIGITYGFRRRWSETLDGYSLFRFGVDLAPHMRHHSELPVADELDKCTKLKELPGLIGDSCPDRDIGHITLVPKQNVAKRDKMYW